MLKKNLDKKVEKVITLKTKLFPKEIRFFLAAYHLVDLRLAHTYVNETAGDSGNG